MLNNIRNFANTKLAGVLVAILIVPFVLWGMGGLFSGGNKNNIVKINNKNITTMDFQKYLNTSNVDLETIKKNIDNNIIEKHLNELISNTMLLMEINDLGLIVSDKILNKKIKENKNFQDNNKKFSRTKYEKFLLSSNLAAPDFEFALRESELKKDLFNYISGGLNSPSFLINNIFKEQTKKVTLNYINLSKIYRNKEDFTNKEILIFIEENKEKLKEKYINFKYSKITPMNLVGIEEFNNLFFEKIDEIENEISNGSSLSYLENKYKLKFQIEENYILRENNENDLFYKKIYMNAENKKIDLLDENDFFILYEITDINKETPNIKDDKFISKVKQMLYNKLKFDFNSDLISKISEKKFNQNDFIELGKNSNIELTTINSINDNEKFTNDSINYIYKMTKNNFALVSDENKNIYLVKILNINYKNINKNSQDFLIYKNKSNGRIRDSLFSSYDFIINNKYKIKINEKALERVKNYFR